MGNAVSKAVPGSGSVLGVSGAVSSRQIDRLAYGQHGGEHSLVKAERRDIINTFRHSKTLDKYQPGESINSFKQRTVQGPSSLAIKITNIDYNH